MQDVTDIFCLFDILDIKEAFSDHFSCQRSGSHAFQHLQHFFQLASIKNYSELMSKLESS